MSDVPGNIQSLIKNFSWRPLVDADELDIGISLPDGNYSIFAMGSSYGVIHGDRNAVDVQACYDTRRSILGEKEDEFKSIVKSIQANMHTRGYDLVHMEHMPVVGDIVSIGEGGDVVQFEISSNITQHIGMDVMYDFQFAQMDMCPEFLILFQARDTGDMEWVTFGYKQMVVDIFFQFERGIMDYDDPVDMKQFVNNPNSDFHNDVHLRQGLMVPPTLHSESIVRSQKGFVPVGDLKFGDTISCIHDDTGEYVAGRVIFTCHAVDVMWTLGLQNDYRTFQFRAHPKHMIVSDGGQYVPMYSIGVGDSVRGRDRLGNTITWRVVESDLDTTQVYPTTMIIADHTTIVLSGVEASTMSTIQTRQVATLPHHGLVSTIQTVLRAFRYIDIWNWVQDDDVFYNALIVPLAHLFLQDQDVHLEPDVVSSIIDYGMNSLREEGITGIFYRLPDADGKWNSHESGDDNDELDVFNKRWVFKDESGSITSIWLYDVESPSDVMGRLKDTDMDRFTWYPDGHHHDHYGWRMRARAWNSTRNQTVWAPDPYGRNLLNYTTQVFRHVPMFDGKYARQTFRSEYESVDIGVVAKDDNGDDMVLWISKDNAEGVQTLDDVVKYLAVSEYDYFTIYTNNDSYEINGKTMFVNAWNSSRLTVQSNVDHITYGTSTRSMQTYTRASWDEFQVFRSLITHIIKPQLGLHGSCSVVYQSRTNTALDFTTHISAANLSHVRPGSVYQRYMDTIASSVQAESLRGDYTQQFNFGDIISFVLDLAIPVPIPVDFNALVAGSADDVQGLRKHEHWSGAYRYKVLNMKTRESTYRPVFFESYSNSNHSTWSVTRRRLGRITNTDFMDCGQGIVVERHDGELSIIPVSSLDSTDPLYHIFDAERNHGQGTWRRLHEIRNLILDLDFKTGFKEMEGGNHEVYDAHLDMMDGSGHVFNRYYFGDKRALQDVMGELVDTPLNMLTFGGGDQPIMSLTTPSGQRLQVWAHAWDFNFVTRHKFKTLRNTRCTSYTTLEASYEMASLSAGIGTVVGASDDQFFIPWTFASADKYALYTSGMYVELQTRPFYGNTYGDSDEYALPIVYYNDGYVRVLSPEPVQPGAWLVYNGDDYQELAFNVDTGSLTHEYVIQFENTDVHGLLMIVKQERDSNGKYVITRVWHVYIHPKLTYRTYHNSQVEDDEPIESIMLSVQSSQLLTTWLDVDTEGERLYDQQRTGGYKWQMFVGDHPKPVLLSYAPSYTEWRDQPLPRTDTLTLRAGDEYYNITEYHPLMKDGLAHFNGIPSKFLKHGTRVLVKMSYDAGIDPITWEGTWVDVTIGSQRIKTWVIEFGVYGNLDAVLH